MGESCSKDQDCDRNLACVRNMAWPHESVCKVYRETGMYCDEDYDCPLDHVCHYETNIRVRDGMKTCMQAYSFTTETFGWVGGAVQNWETKMLNGQVCQTGFARRTGVDRGTCDTLTNVRNHLGTIIQAPY